MTQPADKPFTNAPPADVGFVPPAPTTPSAWTPQPVPGSVDLEQNFPDPLGRTKIEPDQTLALDLEINQFLNRQTLVFKAMGEEMLVYRQKKFGQLCACVDPATNQAQDGCQICFCTRFVGGYDLMGKTAGFIGANPLTRALTEFGIKLSQKPIMYLLPDMVIKDRDFVLAKARNPATDEIRFQAEPVVRAAHDPNIDPLSKLNARKVLKISLTPDTDKANPPPVITPGADQGYDLPPQAGGGEDFVDGVDFVLTGGELVVQNALTPPPNVDSRVLRILGKRAPLSPPDGETLTGQTIPVQTLYPNAGLSAGLPASAFCRAAQPQAFSVTLTNGTGADAGFFLITLIGATGSGISDQTRFPADTFLVTVAGSAILWLGANRPTNGATYYVSYEAALNVTRRYQVLNVTGHHFQGVAVAQEAEIELMDQTHPIYGLNSIYDLGAPLDREVGDSDVQRKFIGQKSGLVTDVPNNQDPRFVNPGDFL